MSLRMLEDPAVILCVDDFYQCGNMKQLIMDKINLADKLARFSECWSPRIVGELNGQHVKVVKIKGEFLWHEHEKEDELFLVITGKMIIHLRDRAIELSEGEFFIVPKGIEHKPAAEEEAHILIFEPASTVNTGTIRNERTVDRPERI